MWYSTHLNHLLSQRVVFLYYLFPHKIILPAKVMLGTNYDHSTTDGASGEDINLQHTFPCSNCT